MGTGRSNGIDPVQSGLPPSKRPMDRAHLALNSHPRITHREGLVFSKLHERLASRAAVTRQGAQRGRAAGERLDGDRDPQCPLQCTEQMRNPFGTALANSRNVWVSDGNNRIDQSASIMTTPYLMTFQSTADRAPVATTTREVETYVRIHA